MAPAFTTTTALAVFVALLLCHQGAMAGGPGPKPTHYPKGAAAANGFSVTYLGKAVEKTDSGLPLIPFTPKGAAKNFPGKVNNTTRVKPVIVATPPGAPTSGEVFTLPATSGGAGRKMLEYAHGRSLQAKGDPCTIIINNKCKRRKSFQVQVGYYTYYGLAGESGWEAQGYWTIAYNRGLRFRFSQTLYVRISNGARVSSSNSADFCVTNGAFQVLEADDGYFYSDEGSYIDQEYYCSDIYGGYVQGGFYPARCGYTYTAINC